MRIYFCKKYYHSMDLQSIFTKAFKKDIKQTLESASKKLKIALKDYANCSPDVFLTKILHIENMDRK